MRSHDNARPQEGNLRDLVTHCDLRGSVGFEAEGGGNNFILPRMVSGDGDGVLKPSSGGGQEPLGPGVVFGHSDDSGLDVRAIAEQRDLPLFLGRDYQRIV